MLNLLYALIENTLYLFFFFFVSLELDTSQFPHSLIEYTGTNFTQIYINLL